VEEPPGDNRRCYEEHAECLVPPEDPRLLGSPFSFGNLLVVRLNAGFNHVQAFGITHAPETLRTMPSIGASVSGNCKFVHFHVPGLTTLPRIADHRLLGIDFALREGALS
jgi:hypothetical protein